LQAARLLQEGSWVIGFFFGRFELMFGVGWLIGKVAPMGREYRQERIGAEDSKDRL
jgi:hypothetical protein